MDTRNQFLNALSRVALSNVDRAIALLWWHELFVPSTSKSPRALNDELIAGGYSAQNVARLRRALEADARTRKAGKDLFSIRLGARPELDRRYLSLLHSRPVPRSDSVLASDLFTGTRVYIERVVAQINASYLYALYDCCAVMCRRLLETLVIECYEAAGRSDNIRGADRNYMMFSGLLSVLQNDTTIHLSRNAIKGLTDFKRLGDQSAHNRRFNARKDDIDRIRDGLRLASEELLSLARLSN